MTPRPACEHGAMRPSRGGAGGLRVPGLRPAAAGWEEAADLERRGNGKEPPSLGFLLRGFHSRLPPATPERSQRAESSYGRGRRAERAGGRRVNAGKKGELFGVFSLRLNFFLLLSLVMNNPASAPPRHYSYFTRSSSGFPDTSVQWPPSLFLPLNSIHLSIIHLIITWNCCPGCHCPRKTGTVLLILRTPHLTLSGIQ